MPENSGQSSSDGRRRLSDFLRSLSFGSERDGRYRYFDTPRSRQELYQVGRTLAEYMHDRKIPNVAFIDRSARPAYLTLRAYWHAKYPSEPLPNIYFVSPKGFRSSEYLAQAGFTGLPRILEDAATAHKKGEVMEDVSRIRSEREVDEDVASTYSRLVEDKDKPFLLFDTCVHTGDGVVPVIDSFRRLGFDQLQFGVASDARNYSGIRPDMTVMHREPDKLCYPFHYDDLTDKSYGTVHAIKYPISHYQGTANTVRQEISRVMRDQIALHSVLPQT